MKPLMGFALTHSTQPSLHNLEGIGLQVDEDKQQPILGGRQRAVRVRGVPAGSTPLPIEAPAGHMRLKRGLQGRDSRLKLVHRETGQIE